MKATAIANSNIALIKYWGMRDERLILPANSSISFTMDRLQTVTTVEFDESLKKDEMVLDGKRATPKEHERVVKFLDVVRSLAKKNEKTKNKKMKNGKTEKTNEKIKFARVVSNNSFPKAAGLASSASGFAALAAAASKAAGLGLVPRELSMLARMGSGSASRSVFGGVVEWQAGRNKDGSDCYARQLSPPDKWLDVRNVIAITASHEKLIGSMEAMKRTASTSELFPARLTGVEERLAVVRSAVAAGNFEAMALSIMQESDSMHAVMLDSWPPVAYLNEASLLIMRKVVELNGSHGKPVAAYTFDAGPNAHVFTTSRREREVRGALGEIEGIEKIMVSGVGDGVRYPAEHLF